MSHLLDKWTNNGSHIYALPPRPSPLPPPSQMYHLCRAHHLLLYQQCAARGSNCCIVKVRWSRNCGTGTYVVQLHDHRSCMAIFSYNTKLNTIVHCIWSGSPLLEREMIKHFQMILPVLGGLGTNDFSSFENIYISPTSVIIPLCKMG